MVVRPQLQTVEMSTHDTGFVYVMSNRAMPGLVKVGFTTLLPEERASQLSRHTGVPVPFDVEFRALTMRWKAVEGLVHQKMDGARVSSRREFFALPVDKAVESVRECVLEVNGIDAWTTSGFGSPHPLGGRDRVVLPLEAGQVFVLLSNPSPLKSPPSGGWQPLDLWQAHAVGDQLEIYATAGPGETAGFGGGDVGGEDDPVPYLDRSENVANGTLNGKEQLAPGDRLLWLEDGDDPEKCKSVLFEARDYCQVACRTWSPQFTEEGFPLILNALVRDPSKAMLFAAQEAITLPMPRNWGPRPAPRGDQAFPLPGPERWLPQLRPKGKRPRRKSGS